MSSPPAQTTRPTRGDELELVVDSLAHGGAGVARTGGGYVVFVAGGLPGDRVKVVVGKAKKAYAEARVSAVVEPGPDRIEPRAGHPGVPWQVLRYEKQLEIKRRQVGEALTRIGRLSGFELEPIVPAIEQWRYRNKLEYSFGSDPDTGELVCGFHAPGRFDRIVPMTDCLLASERANAAREQVLAWCRVRGLEAWDRRTQTGVLRNLVVREGQRTGALQVRLVTTPADFGAGELHVDGADSLLWTRTADLGEHTRGDTVLLAGTETLHERLGDLDFHISPDAFFQTNTPMAEVLYGVAAEFAQLHGTERVLDLFSGIGAIGLTLASRARAVIGVEMVKEAVADAAANARLNGIGHARFVAGDVRTTLRDLLAETGRPDALVVDPPRAGLSQKVVRRIVEAQAPRIVYVSCNPTTLAPNAAQLVEAGYEFKRVRPVDLFPQTPHIECVALFECPPGVTPRNPDRE